MRPNCSKSILLKETRHLQLIPRALLSSRFDFLLQSPACQIRTRLVTQGAGLQIGRFTVEEVDPRAVKPATDDIAANASQLVTLYTRS